MKHIYLFILLLSHSAFGQFNNPSGIWEISHAKKADALFEQNFYEEAIVHYRKEIETYDFSEDIIRKLAVCYKKLSDYRMESNYYTIMLRTGSIEDPVDMYNYAESLLSTGQYEDAELWFNNYLDTIQSDQVAKNKLKGLAEIDNFYKDSLYTKLSPFEYNSDHTEFGAVPFREGLLFSSSRDKDLIIKHDNLRGIESLLDIYYVPFTEESNPDSIELERIQLSHHYKSNDGPVAVGDQLIVISRNIGKQKDNVYNSLGLQFFTDEGNKLKHLYEFPYNDPSYSIMHPTLSEGEDTIFFASDMPGGFGGMDIFYSAFNGESWSQPTNIGSTINTPADEVFPFYGSGSLYFASNGHEGLGGLDLYVLRRDSEGEYLENLGYPLNSGWDDFSLYVKENKGFLASNRPGGSGHDDIYEFEMSEKPEEEIIPVTVLKLNIIDIINGEIIDSASVVLMDLVLKTEYSFLTDTEGGITEELPASNYQLDVSKEGYELLSIEIDLNRSSMIVEEMYLNPNFSLENISLDSIQFELDDFQLSKGAEDEIDHIIGLMNKYSDLNLEIAAHTDSRGEASYNFWLSEMRAASTANYLIDQGIPFERVNILGFGEENLLNHCKDGVDCSEEEHAANRRIEFRFFFNEE